MEKETYTVSTHCTNCGYEDRRQKEKGCKIFVYKIECPKCGCTTLREERYESGEPKFKL